MPFVLLRFFFLLFCGDSRRLSPQGKNDWGVSCVNTTHTHGKSGTKTVNSTRNVEVLSNLASKFDATTINNNIRIIFCTQLCNYTMRSGRVAVVKFIFLAFAFFFILLRGFF